MPAPLLPTDDEARGLARQLIQHARFGALGVITPETGCPMVTRVGLVPGPDGLPLFLASDLSSHTQALKHAPMCSLMVGEPESRGDPLTHPRLSLQGEARFIRHGDTEHAALAEHFVTLQPKAKLYIGFADFSLIHIAVSAALLNAGFGKAYALGPGDFS